MEELNRFDIDGIENLEGLPRFEFMNEECGNLKVINDGESLLEILKEEARPFKIAC